IVSPRFFQPLPHVLPYFTCFPSTALFRSCAAACAPHLSRTNCRKSATPAFHAAGLVLRRGVLREPQWSLKGRLCTITYPFHAPRSEEHTSELQSRENLVCRLLLEKKKVTS